MPETYDPRCRVWYQDAQENTTGEMIVTDPYEDAESGALVVTVAASVLNGSSSGVLGVVGIDMDFGEVEESIESLRVLDDEGYAYLLTPGDEGSVAAHKNLRPFGGIQTIFDVEEDLDEASFGEILTRIAGECSGNATYVMGDDDWILSWEHERVTGWSSLESANGPGESDAACVEGFAVVVTVSKSAFLSVSAWGMLGRRGLGDREWDTISPSVPSRSWNMEGMPSYPRFWR